MADELNDSVPSDIDPNASAPTPADHADKADDGPVDIDAELDEQVEADADGENGEAETGDDDEEFVTVERNGKSYTIPKALEAELLMQSDYTKKTQTVAEERKALEREREAHVQQAQIDSAEMTARVRVNAIDARLKEYANVDWQAAQAADPIATNAAWMEYQQLRDSRSEAANFLREREAHRTNEAQQDYATRITATKEFAAKEIPGWSPELDKKLTDFAVAEMDLSPDFLKGNINPRLYKMLHRAFVGDQALKRAATQKPTPAATAAPLKTVAAKTGTTAKSVDQMSIEDHIAAERRRSSKPR